MYLSEDQHTYISSVELDSNRWYMIITKNKSCLERFWM